MSVAPILPLVASILPRSAAIDIAGRAKVPACHREFFCNCVCGMVRCVWEQQAQPPERAFLAAANAILELREAYHSFGQESFVRLDRVLNNEPANLDSLFDRLRQTLWEIDRVFSAGIGRSVISDEALGPLGKRGAKRKPDDIGEAPLRYVVEGLLLCAEAAKGRFTFDGKPPGRGTLLDALNVLRTHLPPDTIPPRPPLSTIKRIIDHYYSVPA